MITINSNLSYNLIKARQAVATNPSSKDQELFDLVDRLTILVTHALTSKENFSVSAYKLFDDVFKLRIAGLKSLIQKREITAEKDYKEVITNLDTQLKEASFPIPSNKSISKEAIENLRLNLSFATRTLHRVFKSAINNEEEDYYLDNPTPDIFTTSYKGYTNFIRTSLPVELREQMFKIIGSSLMLEVGLIAVDILTKNHYYLEVSDNKIKELSELLVDNAQLYGATAIKLGMIGKKKKRQIVLPDFSEEELKEEQQLAELGIGDYHKTLENE